MQKGSTLPTGVLNQDDDQSPVRQLYLDHREPVTLHYEYAKEEAVAAFNKMPEVTLPPLPWGYQWASHNGKHSIIKHSMADDHALKVILFGPNKEGQINFLFQVDDITHYSFAHTKTGRCPDRSYPMTNDNYKVPGFDYSKTKFDSHVRGHLIDHQDTMQVGLKSSWSTFDHRNYIPEPPEYEWGLGIRNQQVAALRKSPEKTAYAQIIVYPDKPKKTSNKVPVPEGGYFTSFSVIDANYERLTVYDVNWGESMKRPAGIKVLEHAQKSLTSSIQASPIVKVYSPDDSDRTLRYQARELNKTANAIKDGTVKSRHPYRAEFFPRAGAADVELAHSNYQFQAAITADGQGNIPTAKHYVKRSLQYAEDLKEYDVKEPFSQDISQLGLLLFESKENDATWGDQDIDSLNDQFKSLSHS